MSRSASIIISYLMKSKNWKYDEAYSYVKQKRSLINPNSGFVTKLKLYEITLASKNDVI
jgi:protein-tyrosine phosphatase